MPKIVNLQIILLKNILFILHIFKMITIKFKVNYYYYLYVLLKVIKKEFFRK